jgi:hypothetical protein
MPNRMEYQITLQKDGRFDTYESVSPRRDFPGRHRRRTLSRSHSNPMNGNLLAETEVVVQFRKRGKT